MSMPPPPPMSHAEEGRRPGGLPPDQQDSGFVVCMNVINTVTHLMLGVVAISAFFCINAKKFVYNEALTLEISKLTAHVYLSVIGYVLLVSQAVLSLNPRTGWGDNLKYPQKTKIYWSIQVLGSFLAILGGILAIVGVKEFSDVAFPISILNKGHLETSHQIVGLVAMVLTTVSFVGGLAHLICTNMFDKSIFKALYSCVMTLTLIIAFIAICLAFDEFEEYLLTNTNVDLAISATVLALVGMLIMLVGNLTKTRGKGIV